MVVVQSRVAECPARTRRERAPKFDVTVHVIREDWSNPRRQDPSFVRSMRVAVTGGTGFIGGFVVAALCSAGHTPRCLVRATSDVSRIAHLKFERHEGDVLDADSIKARVAELCVHC